MPRQVTDAPSPLRSGLVHAAASFALFSALCLSAGAAIQIWGDDTSASPVRQLALFETETPDIKPAIKTRLATNDHRPAPFYLTAEADETPGDEWTQTINYPAPPADADDNNRPDLGITYGQSPAKRVNVAAAQAPSQSEATSVRINGVSVTPGQSWQAARSDRALPRAPVDAVTETVAAGRLPRISDDGRTPAGVYARPFANPESRPTVSIILGGLGINYSHTKAAIDELPPEVTLSFAPSTRDLQGWIDRARAAGHEVLLEVPMEPYDFGRERPHGDTLYAGSNQDVLKSRLEAVMSRASGYFGVTNYQGGKFATDTNSVAALTDALAARGLALVEDGSLARAGFRDAAAKSGLRYGLANTPIDVRPDGDEIQTRLLELETLAIEQGSALGSGFAYPVTIDILKAWTGALEAKGVILAPASAVARNLPAPETASKTALNDTLPGGQVTSDTIKTSG